MRVMAISALVLAASVIACQLPAQPGLFGSGNSTELTESQKSVLLPSEVQALGINAFEVKFAALGTNFGKELNSAVNEEIISAEQAARILKEVEMDFAVRLVRLDLLRVNAKLNRIGDGAPGLPRSPEVDKLREQLKSMLESGSSPPGPPVYRSP